MSRSKNKKRPHGAAVKPRSAAQGVALFSRMAWGHTEKILRRNAPLWRRLFAKAGRALDKAAIQESALGGYRDG